MKREDALKKLGFKPTDKPMQVELRKAYNRLALQNSPDKFPIKDNESAADKKDRAEAAERFKDINTAYDVLNPERNKKALSVNLQIQKQLKNGESKTLLLDQVDSPLGHDVRFQPEIKSFINDPLCAEVSIQCKNGNLSTSRRQALVDAILGSKIQKLNVAQDFFERAQQTQIQALIESNKPKIMPTIRVTMYGTGSFHGQLPKDAEQTKIWLDKNFRDFRIDFIEMRFESSNAPLPAYFSEQFLQELLNTQIRSFEYTGENPFNQQQRSRLDQHMQNMESQFKREQAQRERERQSEFERQRLERQRLERERQERQRQERERQERQRQERERGERERREHEAGLQRHYRRLKIQDNYHSRIKTWAVIMGTAGFLLGHFFLLGIGVKIALFAGFALTGGYAVQVRHDRMLAQPFNQDEPWDTNEFPAQLLPEERNAMLAGIDAQRSVLNHFRSVVNRDVWNLAAFDQGWVMSEINDQPKLNRLGR